MAEITRCNRAGFHYNGFLNVLYNSNPAYNAKSPIKFFKKIYFCSNCGTWVNIGNIIPSDDNKIIQTPSVPRRIECQTFIGGLLKSYRRAA